MTLGWLARNQARGLWLGKAAGMSRSPRKVSSIGFYHIIMRGNGKQILFEDDDDRVFFLGKLAEYTLQNDIAILAWCLMDNHVHLVVRDDGVSFGANIGEAMRVLQISYASRYNKKSGHVGHVFQSRYERIPIENARQLLEVVRYVHANPARACICPVNEYQWSSYGEYIASPVLSDTSVVLGEIGGVEGFVEYSKLPVEQANLPTNHCFVRDAQMVEAATRALGGTDPSLLKSLPKRDRDAGLLVLRRNRLTVKQIARLTGIGERTITRATAQPQEVR